MTYVKKRVRQNFTQTETAAGISLHPDAGRAYHASPQNNRQLEGPPFRIGIGAGIPEFMRSFLHGGSQSRRSAATKAGAKSEADRLIVKPGEISPGRQKDRDEEYDCDFEWLNLSDAENAIGMFLSIIMMMEGKQSTQIETKEKRAQRREGANCPLYRAAS